MPGLWPFLRRGCPASLRLTMTEAGAVGRPYLAAWQSLIEAGQMKPGETALITGGAGMVGQAAIAIADWRGAKSIIAGARKADGADHFIDTSSSDLRGAVLELTGGRGADMVVDTVGGAPFEPAVKSLRFGGRLTGLHSHEYRCANSRSGAASFSNGSPSRRRCAILSRLCWVCLGTERACALRGQ